MANISMICHPSTSAVAVDSIEVMYEIQPPGKLWLRYYVECKLDCLILPGPDDGKREDGLWETTCFELFLRDSASDGYLEYNFSPSSNWAAYHFHGYREGMTDWPVAPPEIYCDASDTSFAVEATIALPDILNANVDAALSAVIHEAGDVKSYWALHHPAGKPDFHHPDCFRLRLAAPALP